MNFILHEFTIEFEIDGRWYVETVDVEKTQNSFDAGQPVVHYTIRNKLDDSEPVKEHALLLPFWAQRVANAMASHIKSNHNTAPAELPPTPDNVTAKIPPPPPETLIYRRE